MKYRDSLSLLPFTCALIIAGCSVSQRPPGVQNGMVVTADSIASAASLAVPDHREGGGVADGF